MTGRCPLGATASTGDIRLCLRANVNMNGSVAGREVRTHPSSPGSHGPSDPGRVHSRRYLSLRVRNVAICAWKDVTDVASHHRYDDKKSGLGQGDMTCSLGSESNQRSRSHVSGTYIL